LFTVSPISYQLSLGTGCSASALVRNLRGVFILHSALQVLSSYVEVPGLLRGYGNDIGVLNFLSGAALALSFVYNFSGLAQGLMGGIDVSYGLIFTK
jgi:hypothetical protein